MRALATWCVRHRRWVLAGWLVLLVAMTSASRAVGTDYSDSFSLPNTESTHALDLLQSVLPKSSGDTEQIVVATSDGLRVTSPAVRAAMAGVLRGEDALAKGETTIVSPYMPGGARQVSRDRTIAFASVTLDKGAQDFSTAFARRFVQIATSADQPHVQFAVSGQLAESANKVSIGGTGPALVTAGIVLFVVFGSLFAMMLPLVSAALSLGSAIGLIGLLTHVLKMPDFSPELVGLVGLGVGVDYALFIVSRHRQNLVAGYDVESSIVKAVNTSGRAVLFAGIVVCIALLGMFALGVSFLYGLAVAAAIGVAFTMAAALTFLPALLGFLGFRVLSRRQRARLGIGKGKKAPVDRAPVPAVAGVRSGGFWNWWSDAVARRPIIPAVAALAVIVTVALPFFAMHLGSADEGNDPVGTTTRQAYDLLARGFGPGFNGPLEIVAVGHGTADAAAFGRVAAAVRVAPDVAQIGRSAVIPTHGGAFLGALVVYPRSAPQDLATTDLIDSLRATTIPAAVGASSLRVYVGGNTAIFVDFSRVLTSKLPLFIGVVVLLSFLLLAIVFRSLAVPLTGAAMNLLSAGAAFGIVVAAFEWGWGGALFGVNRPGPVESFLPVMLFAILFGLSMDYQVFLVVRIHEEWTHGADNRQAVRNGLAATGKTITAAAAIMIVVFGSFMLGGARVIREFGLGLAGGILIDAVVIRSTIVPSLMLLLGRFNWWFPARLDRALPHFSVEPPEPAEVEETLTMAGV